MSIMEEVSANAATNDSNPAPHMNTKLIGTTQPSKKKTVSKMDKTKGPKAVHSRPHHNHPSYGDMIKGALSAAKDRKGSSRAAILKYILQNYQVGENASMVNAYLRMGLKRGVASGILTQLKGTGASGSFRLADKTVKKTKKVVKAKSVVTVDVKKPSPKKTEAKTTVKKLTTIRKDSKTKTKPKKKVSKTDKEEAEKKNKKIPVSPKKAKPASSKAKPAMKKKTSSKAEKIAA